MKNEEQIGFAIHTLDLTLRRKMLANARDHGIDEASAMHGWVAGYLYENEDKGDIFQKDIEQRFHIARSSVTGILQLMEQKGYISREPVKSDARLKKLVLTEQGKRLHLTALKHREQMEELMSKDLTDEERAEFFRITEKIKNNLKER